jgi:hypothetical protein
MGDHNGHSKMTVIWWLYRKRSEQSFPPHSEAARMPTNLASQVSGQASLTEDGLARTRAYCAVTLTDEYVGMSTPNPNRRLHPSVFTHLTGESVYLSIL